MIHFELAFAYDVRKGPNFILHSFVYEYPVDPAHIKKNYSFPPLLVYNSSIIHLDTWNFPGHFSIALGIFPNLF